MTSALLYVLYLLVLLIDYHVVYGLVLGEGTWHGL